MVAVTGNSKEEECRKILISRRICENYYYSKFLPLPMVGILPVISQYSVD
jgi:hypothetical protein